MKGPELNEQSLPSGGATADRRRYRTLGVLGRGGFGTVYKARLESKDGFVKDVAIKILTIQDPNVETIARFRDEARILGRVHDRALVGVDPPVQLDGRWAIVMDYVDGCDCRRLLREHGRIPPLAALEIVQEIARALDTLWSYFGDDGEPLRLLHRDLKPGNIQITQFGNVKLLDFGVARADFGSREMVTTDNIGGTIGYVAPERLKGTEGPAGDMWSLGVVLEELVTGTRPDSSSAEVAGTADTLPPELLPAVELARRMRSSSPGGRPDAATVEEECRRLTHAAAGPSLRAWARTHVTSTLETADDRVGAILSETTLSRSDLTWPSSLADQAGAHEVAHSRSRRRVALALAIGVVVLGLPALLLVWRMGTDIQPITPDEQAVTDVPAVVVPAPAPEPSPALPAPEPIVTLAPARPSPAAREPKPVPAGRVEIEGATDVLLTDGTVSWRPDQVPPGTYTVMASFDGAPAVKAGTVTLGAGETVRLECNTRFQRCKIR